MMLVASDASFLRPNKNSKIQTQKARMTQDADFKKKWVLRIDFLSSYIVFILINMQSYHNFVFQYCVFFI